MSWFAPRTPIPQASAMMVASAGAVKARSQGHENFPEGPGHLDTLVMGAFSRPFFCGLRALFCRVLEGAAGGLARHVPCSGAAGRGSAPPRRHGRRAWLVGVTPICSAGLARRRPRRRSQVLRSLSRSGRLSRLPLSLGSAHADPSICLPSALSRTRCSAESLRRAARAARSGDISRALSLGTRPMCGPGRGTRRSPRAPRRGRAAGAIYEGFRG